MNASDTGANEYNLVWSSGDTVYSSSHTTIHRDEKRLTTGKFKCTVAIGTAPMEATSTTKVVNFNADLLDGLSSGSFLRSDTDDTLTGSLLWFGDQDYDGLYWGAQHKDTHAHSGAWGYIRQATLAGGN